VEDDPPDVRGAARVANEGLNGESDGTEVSDDLHLITKAREAIAEGKTVYCISWW